MFGIALALVGYAKYRLTTIVSKYRREQVYMDIVNIIATV